MAVFHFSADIIQRAKGHSVVAAAAYRAGERILEIRTGEVHDYRRRSGVDHREIMAPRGAPGWCKTRAELWNRAEDAERRKDAQVGRQVELALPRELSFKQRRRLVRRFVRKNFTCRGMVADIAYHDQAGENPHVHILLTMRRLGKENGFSRTKERAWNEKAQLESWRSSWALHVNAALRRAGCHSRVDHRTLEAQRLDALAAGDLGLAIKLDRAPGRHFGRAPVAIQARADGIAALTAAQDDEIRTGEVDQPDYEHPAYKAAEYERSWRMQEVLDERERETERRWEDREGERANRNASRLFGLFAQPGGRDVYRAAVTEVITAWRPSVVDLPELPESPLVDRALDVAESSGGCLRRLRDLLEDAEGRSHYRGILDAHGEPISLEDVNRAIEEANRRIAAAADRRDRRRTILFGRPGGRDLYVAMLGEVESARGPTGKPSAATDDLVLDAVESEAARLIRLETLFQKPWGRGLYVANMRALGDRVTLPEIDAAVAAGEALARRAHCVVEGQALRAPLDVALLESEDTTVGDLESAVERAEERRFEERRAAEQEALRERARIEAERRSAEARRLAKEQQKRKDRLESIESQAGGRDLYEKKLAGLDPSWRDRGEPNSERADAALTYAETELARIESERLAAEARRLAEEQQKRKDRLESIESQAGGRDLYEKKLAGLDPSWRDRGEPNSERADAALTYAETELARIESERLAAEARRLAEEQQKRKDRLESIESQAGGRDLYEKKLAGLDPSWRDRGEPNSERADAALTYAETELARIESERLAAEARRLAEEQQKRKDRLESIESQAGGRDLYEKKLAGLDPSWRDRGEPNSERADAALTYAETELARIESERLAAEARRLAEEQQKRKDRLESIESQAGGRDLYEKKLAGLDPSWRDRGEPKVAVIDASLTHAETELKRRAEARQHAARRASRVDRVFGVRGGDVALILTLDRQRANWREAGVSARDVDRALNIAERNPDPTVWATEHALVLDGEQGFPRAGSREWWAGRDVFSRRTEPEERARALSSRLSDRSRVRESIGGGSEAQASSVVGRLVEWLRRQVQKLLRTLHLVDGAADLVMAKLPMAVPMYGQPEVPAVGDEPWKPAAEAGAVAMDVWVLVRERLDRGETAAGAPGCRPEARERAQKKYLEPLVAGELRRAERSWRERRDTARPTRESVVPVVLERHWSGIEELVRIESHRVSGESEKAAELERHRDQVCRSADSVMAGLPMAVPMYGQPEVPAVGDEPWKPAAKAGAVAMDVWVLVRERLDRGETAAGAPGCRPEARERAQKKYLEPLVAGELRRAERSWRERRDTARPTRESVVPVVLERHWSGIEELVRIESHRVSGESEKAAELERHRDQVCRSADSVMAGLPMAVPMYGQPEVPAVGDEPWKPAAKAGAVAMDVWVLVRERLDRGETAAGAPGCRPEARERAQKKYLEPLVAGELRRAERSWRGRRDTARPTRELVVPVVLERHWSGIEELVRIESHRVSGESEKAAELERHRDQVCRSADSVMAGLPMAVPMYGQPEVPAVGDEPWKPAAKAGAVAMDVWVLVRERLDRGETAAGAPGCRPEARERAQKKYLEPLVAGELRRAERSWRERRDTARPTRESVVPVVLERHWSGIEELVRIESHRVSGESEKAAELERHRDQVCRSADSVMAGLPMAAPMYGLPEVPAVEEEWREPVDASPLEAAVFVEVRNRLDREETAAGMERCSHEDRERAEQRYLDAVVEEAVERQRQAYLASERTSPSQRREDIRAAVRREHRSRLGGILAAACRKSGRDGGSLDHPSDGTSARPASGEPAFAPGSVAASAEPGSLRGPDAGHARSGRPAREVGGASPQPADDERSTVPAPSRTEAKGDPCPRSDAGRGTRRARVATPVEQKALATRGKAPTTRIDVPSTASTTGPPSPDTKGSTRAGKKGRGDIGWQR